MQISWAYYDDVKLIIMLTSASLFFSHQSSWFFKTQILEISRQITIFFLHMKLLYRNTD